MREAVFAFPGCSASTALQDARGQGEPEPQAVELHVAAKTKQYLVLAGLEHGRSLPLTASCLGTLAFAPDWASALAANYAE